MVCREDEQKLLVFVYSRQKENLLKREAKIKNKNNNNASSSSGNRSKNDVFKEKPKSAVSRLEWEL